MAQIVMAAASVMNDPKSGPAIRIEAHHAAGVQRPTLATFRSDDSAKAMIGRVAASAITTTTKTGSV